MAASRFPIVMVQGNRRPGEDLVHVSAPRSPAVASANERRAGEALCVVHPQLELGHRCRKSLEQLDSFSMNRMDAADERGRDVARLVRNRRAHRGLEAETVMTCSETK